MQFIQSFFTAVITIFLTLYFSRKYGLSDKDRSIVEKQFQKYESQLQRYIILIPTCGYLIYSILTTLNKQPITDENTYLFVQIILIIFYFIFFGCIWCVFKYLLYSKKIKFLFRMLKKK